MVDIYDYDIKCIESEILMQYYRYNYTEFYCLLELRQRILNRRVLAHQEDILQHIVDFNDALTGALREMYGRAHRIWNSIKENDVYGDDVELEAKCFLSSKYPELHPFQSEYREDLWSALCDSGWNHLYEDGVLLPTFTLPNDINTSFDSFIGMDCPPPNWNEGLDRELTKDLHLTSAFHHLFDHTNFAITDFIYVREFEIKINIESNKKVMTPWEKERMPAPPKTGVTNTIIR